MSKHLSFIDKGSKDKKTVVFLSGFPDNETSGWGELVPTGLEDSHRVIMLCMPDYAKGNRDFKPWGYSFDEIINMIHETLQFLKVQDKFFLVAHDWGAFLGLQYENKYPDRIEKLVLLDVGMLNPKNAPVKHILIILLYQFWFAIAYVISQTISRTLGDIYFKLFFLKPVMQAVGPCPHDVATIPLRELTVSKCYPYYHFWRGQILRTFKEPKYPSCPLLFMYGTRKSCMFHDQAFLRRIDKNPGSRHRAFDAGHWFIKDFGADVLLEISAFFADNRK